MGDTRALERGLMQGGGYLASAIVEWVLAALTTQLAGLAVAFAVSRQHGVRATLLVLRFVPPPRCHGHDEARGRRPAGRGARDYCDANGGQVWGQYQGGNCRPS